MIRNQARRRGAVMMEFVLIIPLVMIILALLFYMGRLVVRVHHASVMARYETWRQVAQGPGPSSNDPLGHPQLNEAFFGGNASTIRHAVDDGAFPEEPYQDLITAASTQSSDARTLADALVYHSGGNMRNSHGHREGFHVMHDNTIDTWDRLIAVTGSDVENPERSPLTRRHVRIGTDWPYTNDWRASDTQWRDTWGVDPHPLRARRDAFWLPWDLALDGVDGASHLEYYNSRSEVPGESLAGLVRGLYLYAPEYRGPVSPND